VNQISQPFWSISATELLQQPRSTAQGLTADEASARLKRYGANLLKPKKQSDALTPLLSQFNSPIILILLFATGLSFFLRDPFDAFIILAIILVGGLKYLLLATLLTAVVTLTLPFTPLGAMFGFGPLPFRSCSLYSFRCLWGATLSQRKW